MTKLQSALLLLVASAGLAHQAYATPASEVDRLFARWNSPTSPGCAVGVVKERKLVLTRSYGMANLDYNIPISPKTVFYVGSTSKQFTAATVAILARQGKLSLDDDIRKYMSEMPQYERPISIRNLIHHTSGIRDYIQLMRMAGMRLENVYLDQELIGLLARQGGLNFPPGDRFLYSNSNYFLLSQIVLRATGKTLRQAAEETIFGPLGMKGTHFHDDRTMIVKSRATGYFPTRAGFSASLTNFDKVGDGGLMTTLEDMYRWDQNFYENTLAGGDPNLIADLVTAPPVPNVDPVYADGQFIFGRKPSYGFGLYMFPYKGTSVVTHGGQFTGFKSAITRFPDRGFSVISLCNVDVDDDAFNLEIADIYLADKLKSEAMPSPPVGDLEQKAVQVPTPEQLAEYVGEYRSDELDSTVNVFTKDSKLYGRTIRAFGVPALPLTPKNKDQFGVSNFVVTFIRDKKGKVSSYTIDEPQSTRNVLFERVRTLQ